MTTLSKTKHFISNCAAQPMLLTLTMMAVLTLTAMALSGCNMMAGLGEDINLGAEWTKMRFDDGFRPERD